MESSILKIKMYPAGNGDAFLISSAGTNILVDGGYPRTFDKYILHDLCYLSNKGEDLDLVITSHIDADHISGLIRFLSLNGSLASPKIVEIKNIWHNSLRSLTTINSSDIDLSDQQLLNSICRRGHPSHVEYTSNEANEISARQGSSLAFLINSGGYIWNGNNGRTSISVEHTQMLNFPNGNIRVIGPTQPRLDDLLQWWKKQLQRLGYKGSKESGDLIDDAFEFLCEHSKESNKINPVPLSTGSHKKLKDVYTPDSSATNGSSIATIVELEEVRILMLADAWAEDIIQELKILQSQGHSMIFDAIKVSHHGSLHNSSPELFELIDAPKFIISSNGNAHNHPDIEVLIEIVDRPASFSRTLYFNYATPSSNAIRKYCSKTGPSFTVLDNATSWIEILKS